MAATPTYRCARALEADGLGWYIPGMELNGLAPPRAERGTIGSSQPLETPPWREALLE